MFTPEQIATFNEVVQSRKSVAPNLFIDRPIEKQVLEQILANAHRAPTHKLTQPWRLKVLLGEKKNALGQFLAETYQRVTPADKLNERKLAGMPAKAAKSGAVVLICMQRDQEESLPEWEEVAATAMAVQNMYLTCTAYGLGCYWSSPGLIKYMHEFMALEQGETCLGIFYMGYYEKDLLPSSRVPLENRVEWYD